MKIVIINYLAIAVFAVSVAFTLTACKRDNDKNSLPSLITNSASDISATTATLGGNITNAGTPAYTERGVVYATTQNPTTDHNKTAVSGTGTGDFSAKVSGLTANTMYYVRAYAINEVGTAYGEQVNFTTSEDNSIGSESELYVMDISEEETEWDFMMIAYDGSIVLLKIDDYNTNVVTELYVKPDKNSDDGFSIFFNENGFPETAVVGDYIICFGNFRDNLFDFALIHPNNSIQYFYDIETDIEWDEFFEETGISRMFIKKIFNKAVKAVVKVATAVVDNTFKVLSCGLDVVTFNPLMVATCGSAIISVVDDIVGLPTVITDFGDFLGAYATAISCTTGQVAGCILGIADIAQNGSDENNTYKEEKSQLINQADGVLNRGDDPNFWKPQKGDVYVAGYGHNEQSMNFESFAIVWKNGVAHLLTNKIYSASGNSASASSVFVSGNDVYVAGYEENAQGIRIAKLWKNGVAQNLTDGKRSASATSIYVSGNDVYVTIHEYWHWSVGYGVDKLLKNSVIQNITNETQRASFNSVFVSGKNVYVAGFEDNAQGKTVAKVWKDGVSEILPNEASYAYASSVYVSDNDVYVAGTAYLDDYDEYYGESYSLAKLWKNGIAQNFIYENRWSYASSVFVSGNDVYVAGSASDEGSYDSVAKLWKNGVAQNLTTIKSWLENTTSVFVSGSDVYMVGYENTWADEIYGAYAVPKFWKNGIAQYLPIDAQYARANSVFVVE